jgi:hypothetical protein
VSFGRSELDLEFPYVDEDGFKGMDLVTFHATDIDF